MMALELASRKRNTQRLKKSSILVKRWTDQSISLSVQKLSIWVSPSFKNAHFTFFLDALTPTVKLNGLAMKRGESAIYKILDRKPMYNNQQYNSQVHFYN